jgi:myo-inositol catabolism protein IolS
MKYRRLGSTGLEVSVVGIGTWQFGGEWGKDFTDSEVLAIIDAGRETGINLIDTAECYGDHLSERLVGMAIASDRERWIVATKFGHRFTGRFERDELWSAEEVSKQLDSSLKALRTDYIDLYQFHSGPNERFDDDELWSTLARLKETGKIRHLGVSVSASTQEYQTAKARSVGAETIQVIYNRLQQSPESEVFPACREHDLGVLARVPLASGFLSGKYRSGDSFSATDVRSRREKDSIRKTLEEVEQILAEEIPAGVPAAEWALAWCLRDEVVSCVIPGCKSPQQVRQNAKAADRL